MEYFRPKIIVLVLCTCFSVIFSSCKKSDGDSQVNLLTSASWKVSVEDKSPGNNPPGNNVYYPVEQCTLDDQWQFSSTGQVTISRGPVPCNLIESKKETLSYSFDQAGKKFILNGEEFIVIELTAQQFKYYKNVSSSSGNQRIIYLMEH